MPTSQQNATIQHLFSQGEPMAFAKGQIIMGNESVPNGVYFRDSRLEVIETVVHTFYKK
jgi:hypothetical protein